MLSNAAIATLLEAAEVAVPLELCGLLFNHEQFQACKNVSFNPWHEFEIAHAEYLKHMADYGEAPWAIVHSHPRGSAAMSVKDWRLLDAMQATNVTMLMVIVGLQPREIRIFTKEADHYTLMWMHASPPMEVSWPLR